MSYDRRTCLSESRSTFVCVLCAIFRIKYFVRSYRSMFVSPCSAYVIHSVSPLKSCLFLQTVLIAPTDIGIQFSPLFSHDYLMPRCTDYVPQFLVPCSKASIPYLAVVPSRIHVLVTNKRRRIWTLPRKSSRDHFGAKPMWHFSSYPFILRCPVRRSTHAQHAPR